MAEEDIQMMMLAPLHLEVLALPGSVLVKANCGHVCTISASGRAFLAADPEVYTMCANCAAEDTVFVELRANQGKQFMVPGAQQELTDLLGVGGLDQVLAAARDAGFVLEEREEF